MEWKQYVQSFLSVWHKRLLRATLDVRDMQENVHQSNLQLIFSQTISLIPAPKSWNYIILTDIGP